jgi:hypothetical protein
MDLTEEKGRKDVRTCRCVERQTEPLAVDSERSDPVRLISNNPVRP